VGNYEDLPANTLIKTRYIVEQPLIISTNQSTFQNFYPNITISPNKEAADFSYLFIFFY
jgi:hypothetical protein